MGCVLVEMKAQRIYISRMFAFLQELYFVSKNFFIVGVWGCLDNLDFFHRVRIPDKEREDWMPVGRAGDELFCYQVNARKDWRVGGEMLRPTKPTMDEKVLWDLGILLS